MMSQPSRDEQLAEVAAWRQKLDDVEQEKQDLEVMLKMPTDHAEV